jgi:hypothetical protein
MWVAEVVGKKDIWGYPFLLLGELDKFLELCIFFI